MAVKSANPQNRSRDFSVQKLDRFHHKTKDYDLPFVIDVDLPLSSRHRSTDEMRETMNKKSSRKTLQTGFPLSSLVQGKPFRREKKNSFHNLICVSCSQISMTLKREQTLNMNTEAKAYQRTEEDSIGETNPSTDESEDAGPLASIFWQSQLVFFVVMNQSGGSWFSRTVHAEPWSFSLSTGIARHGGFSGLIIIAPCSRGQS
jgi:hypothetical protein